MKDEGGLVEEEEEKRGGGFRRVEGERMVYFARVIEGTGCFFVCGCGSEGEEEGEEEEGGGRTRSPRRQAVG